ncbi:hypothetical protein CR513_11881, partial [Mucuna pruriens]
MTPKRRSVWRSVCIMMRYRNSKICSGRMAPGKRTSGRGNRGSSTTSSEFGEFVWCFSENEEAEHRRVELGFRRRCRRMLRCCGREVGDLGFRESPIGGQKKFWFLALDTPRGNSGSREIGPDTILLGLM